MRNNIDKEINQSLQKIKFAKTIEEVEGLRLAVLGKNGSLTKLLRAIKKYPPHERASVGQRVNQLKLNFISEIENRKSVLFQEKISEDSNAFKDLTINPNIHHAGAFHPLEKIKKELIQLFWQIGFSVADGPEIETDWYCFEALNIPPDHPARDMQDTFYLKDGRVMRTHTSSVQIRYMESNNPPIRIIAPGKVYRNEDEDLSHSWAFTNMEGLVVDRGITLSDMKGTLEYMLKGIFGEQTTLRLRPNYFPYVEPAVEADASCPKCNQKSVDCRLCKGTGWVELLGAGMVHPQVLRNVNIDPNQYSGFAFGVGLERLAVIKYGIEDVRYLWRPDLKFMEQF